MIIDEGLIRHWALLCEDPANRPDGVEPSRREIETRSAQDVLLNIRKTRNEILSLRFDSVRNFFSSIKRRLGMSFWSQSYYLKISCVNQTVMLRLSDHPANGRNFERNTDCSRFVSMFIRKSDQNSATRQTPVPYSEIEYKREMFKSDPTRIAMSMLDQIERISTSRELEVDEDIGTLTNHVPQKEVRPQ